MDYYYLIYPFAAAILYAVAAVFMKSATSRGVSVLHVTLLANVVSAAAFLSFLSLPAEVSFSTFIPGIILGIFFFLGQIFMTLSLGLGEVSVATPVISSKVVVVALLMPFIAREMPAPTIWAGALLTVGGITCLQNKGRHAGKSKALQTVFLAFLAALFFGIFDVINQVWSRKYGFGTLVPPSMVVAALLSLFFLPFAKTKISARKRLIGLHLGLGLLLITAQSLLVVWSVGTFGHATEINIVYGSRGLWGLVVVWLLGPLLENGELAGGDRALLRARIFGAVLIALSIALVLL